MPVIKSKLNTRTAEFADNAAHNRALVDDLQAQVDAVRRGGPERAREKHLARGKLLPRERVRADAAVYQVRSDALLDALQEIEANRGRDRSPQAVRWGPRILDLDLLLYGDAVIVTERLTVPHPRLAERAFVLAVGERWHVPNQGRP